MILAMSQQFSFYDSGLGGLTPLPGAVYLDASLPRSAFDGVSSRLQRQPGRTRALMTPLRRVTLQCHMSFGRLRFQPSLKDAAVALSSTERDSCQDPFLVVESARFKAGLVSPSMH